MQAIIALDGDFAFYQHENFFISIKFSALSYHRFLFYKLSTAKSIFKKDCMCQVLKYVLKNTFLLHLQPFFPSKETNANES